MDRSVCRLCSLGAWGQKRPQNTGVWPLALLGLWVAGMSGPLDTGEGGRVAQALQQGSVRGSAAATGGSEGNFAELRSGVILRRCVVQVGEPKHLVGQPGTEVGVLGVRPEQFGVCPHHGRDQSSECRVVLNPGILRVGVAAGILVCGVGHHLVRKSPD